jgi:hypothetical protein
MDICPYTFDTRLSAGFASLCDRLYGSDRNWIQPPRHELLRPFAPSFSFYKSAGNAHCHFAAMRGGEVVGHLSALVNVDARGLDGRPAGYLGLFESVDDEEVVRALARRALDWLRRRGDVHSVLGPVNFDIWHGYRLKRSGFDRDTFLGEPHNPPYYSRLFEGAGLGVVKTWCSTNVDGRENLARTIAGREERYRQVLADGYRFVPFRAGSANDFHTLHAVLCESYGNFVGFTPIALDEFVQLYRAPLSALDTRFLTLVYDPHGEAAGFCLTYPDAAPALRAMHGRRHLYAKTKFLLHRRRARSIIFHSLGVTPAEMKKRNGLGSAIVFHTVRGVLDAGFDGLVAALMAEDSPARSFVGDNIHHADREYVLYGAPL